MIVLDTNALVRFLVRDDPNQAKAVHELVSLAEEKGEPLVVLSEVLMETVWVLERSYRVEREAIADFLDALLQTPIFHLPDKEIIKSVGPKYRESGSFTDQVIAQKAHAMNAALVFSFDKNFQKLHPGLVTDSVSL